MKIRRLEQAFALPTVVITAVILMTLLVGGLSAVTSVRRALNEQYYQTLAREASEAGIAYAKSCVDQNLANNASSGWGYDTTTPLDTGDTCSGAAQTGVDCVGAPTAKPDQCYVFYDTTSSPPIRTSFRVSPVQILGSEAYTLQVTASVNLYSSAGTVSKTYAQTQLSRSATDMRYGIATGNDTVCSIQAGKLYCWGKNTDGQVGIGTTTNVTTPQLVSGKGALGSSLYVVGVATGIQHTCAIASTTPSIVNTKQMFCWGDNGVGQFGISSPTSKTTPYLVNTLSSSYATAISARDHNCIIAVTDTDPNVMRMFCWGDNGNLQAGEKDDGTHPNPKRISGWLATRDTGASTLTGVLQIMSVSGGDSCGINSVTYKYIFCMGNANHGMLGNNTTTDSDRANWVEITGTSTKLGKGKKIVTNNGRACALSQYNADDAATFDTKYHVWCWGANWAYDSNYLDWRIDSGAAFYAVKDRLRAKRVHTNVTTGTRTCVYDSTVGPDGSYDCTTIAAAGHTATNLYNADIADIATSDYNMCIVIDGVVYCSGYNDKGQLGQGVISGPTPSAADTQCTSVTNCVLVSADEAKPVFGSLKGKYVVSLVGGNGHFCAITSDHLVYCWGANGYGQLGDGTTTNRPSPVRALVPHEVIY